MKVSIVIEGSKDQIAFQNALRLLGRKSVELRVFHINGIDLLPKQLENSPVQFIPTNKHAIDPLLFEYDDLVMISAKIMRNHLHQSTMRNLASYPRAAVLIVPSEDDCQKPKEILLAFNQTCPQKTALKKIRQLKKTLELKLEIVHISLMGEINESFYELETKLALDQLDKSFRNEHYTFFKSETLTKGFRQLLIQHHSSIISIPFQQHRTVLDLFRPKLHKQLVDDMDKQFNLLLNL